MITFNRTVFGTQYYWTDADGNQLEINLEQFNLLKPEVQYEDQTVWLNATASQQDTVSATPITSGLTLTMYLTGYPGFAGIAQSVSFKDSEFVRLIRNQAVRLTTPVGMVFTK